MDACSVAGSIVDTMREIRVAVKDVSTAAGPKTVANVAVFVAGALWHVHGACVARVEWCIGHCDPSPCAHAQL